MKRILLLLALVLAQHHAYGSSVVHVITVDATINPGIADFIGQSIQRAEADGVECLVIRLNTPGGFLEATRTIVSDLLNTRIPIVVYVSPPGARAGSAGVFITLAAHVAAMAPGTNIGAAHPVGTTDSIMIEKGTNDAAAFIRTVSEKRKRNVQWAEDAVRKSISFTETEALRDSVIDLIAASLQELLVRIDGKEVEIEGSTKPLRTAEAEVREFKMGWKHVLLDILSNPNVFYILLMLAGYGIFFELYNPGSILPGVVGVIALLLALYASQTLPLNYAGFGLILAAIIMFILEIKVPSYGLLTIGGVIALFLGSIMLIDSESSLEFVSISWSVIIPSVILTTAFFVFAVGMGIKAQKRKPTTGLEGLVGERGEAITALAPDGQIRVHGEIWNATAEEGKIKSGEPVRVVRAQGFQLIVRKHS